MKNKNVGFLITGIAIIVGVLIFTFNHALKRIVSQACVHGPTCPMYDTIAIQTWISSAIAGLIFIIGLFLILAKENERLIIKHRTITKKEKRKPIDTSGLSKEEKKVVEILSRENNAMFQKTLMEKLGVGKVGMTRLLDKLEAKQIVERKRRGMNNIIVLKQ